MRTIVLASSLVLAGLISAVPSLADPIWVKPPAPTIVMTPTPIPEIGPPFGRIIYRAARVASLESLGVTMIACRHRDPVPRRFAVQFFSRIGRMMSSIHDPVSAPIPAGKKIVYVTDGNHFENADVLNLILGHLSIGTARVVSDAKIVHCVGKIRMDGGAYIPTYWDEIGLVREGQPLPVLPERWLARPQPTPQR